MLAALLLPLGACYYDYWGPKADSGWSGDSGWGGSGTWDSRQGVAQGYFVGDFSVSGNAYTSGHFGLGFFGSATNDWVCTIEGELDEVGTAPAGCPDCEWTFDLSPVQSSIADGDACRNLGLRDGDVDGWYDYYWGFARVYYYDYGGTPLPLDDTVMLYLDGDGWIAFSFNYGGRDWVDVGDTSVDFVRPITTASGYAYYYYY
jgi:hypothetical protein